MTFDKMRCTAMSNSGQLKSGLRFSIATTGAALLVACAAACSPVDDVSAEPYVLWQEVPEGELVSLASYMEGTLAVDESTGCVVIESVSAGETYRTPPVFYGETRIGDEASILLLDGDVYELGEHVQFGGGAGVVGANAHEITNADECSSYEQYFFVNAESSVDE